MCKIKLVVGIILFVTFSASAQKTIKIWDSDFKKQILEIFPLPPLVKIQGAKFTGIKCDDLSERDFLSLKQNGAILEEVKSSC